MRWGGGGGGGGGGGAKMTIKELLPLIVYQFTLKQIPCDPPPPHILTQIIWPTRLQNIFVHLKKNHQRH